MTLKDYIINNLDQIEIFSEYLDISEDDIKYSINFKSKIKSPFHRDSDPSLSFKYYGNKLICRDFGKIEYSGDIFQIVGKCIHKDCADSKDFVEICRDIINTILSKRLGSTRPKMIVNEETVVDPTKISIIPRNFNTRDFRYFWQYYFPRELVMESYIAVNTYSINDIPSKYFSSAGDPCYAYINNPNCYKLLFPFRVKTAKRFISNNKFPIELINTISHKDYTVLIKGYKDKILMDYVCSLLKIDNIQFLPVSSETVKIPDEIISLLKRYTNKKLLTLFDLDKCGVESSIYYRDNYGLGNIFLGDNYATKDPTDLVKAIKLEPLLKRFYKIYKTL